MSEQVMTVMVPAEDWNRLVELKTKRAAINKEIALLEDGMAIPSGSAIADSMKLEAGDKVRIRIVNGVGSICGTGSVYHVGEKTVPACWVRRLA
jgi:hypothetical protein